MADRTTSGRRGCNAGLPAAKAARIKTGAAISRIAGLFIFMQPDPFTPYQELNL